MEETKPQSYASVTSSAFSFKINSQCIPQNSSTNVLIKVNCTKQVSYFIDNKAFYVYLVL